MSNVTPREAAEWLAITTDSVGAERAEATADREIERIENNAEILANPEKWANNE